MSSSPGTRWVEEEVAGVKVNFNIEHVACQDEVSLEAYAFQLEGVVLMKLFHIWQASETSY